MVNKLLNKEYYNTVLSQTFSPCGTLLITGDIYGALSVFNLTKIVGPDDNITKEELTPKTKIVVKNGFQINSLISSKNHLLVGGYGEIYAYSWKSIKGSIRNIQPSWTVEIPSDQDDFNRAEVNSLICDENEIHLYAGCGDNKIYIFNLENRRTIKVLSGHADYIHCICKSADNTLLSAGEDGLINLWDLKSHKVVQKIEPSLNPNIARNALGKWIGALDCNEDYIVCGGGPRLALYHYRFLTNSTIFPIEDQGIHVAQIYEDKVFAGGRSKLFYEASFNGDIITEIPMSGPCTCSLVIQEEPFKIMCIAGSSPKIDISLNFMYKDKQLSLY